MRDVVEEAYNACMAPEWLTRLIDDARERARLRVLDLRGQYPTENDLALGERLVTAAANRAGWWGAATGTLALVTLPVGLPAGIAVSLALEAELLLALLEVFGFSSEGESGRLRLYALWVGAGFADAAKSAGLRLGARAVGRVIAESLPARLIGRLNPVLLRAILRRLGLGWLPRALKLWPVLGAPIGFLLDRAALRSLGSAALATLDDAALLKRREARKAEAAATAAPQRKPKAKMPARKTGTAKAARTAPGAPAKPAASIVKERKTR